MKRATITDKTTAVPTMIWFEAEVCAFSTAGWVVWVAAAIVVDTVVVGIGVVVVTGKVWFKNVSLYNY